MMALRAGCDLAQVFAAIAPVIANLPADILVTCKPARPLPILIMNGTRDPLVPWHGGGVGFAGARGKVLATETTLAFWIANNGCEGDPDLERRPKRSGESSAVVLKRWTACRAGAPVVLVEIEGGGHRIPGREDRPHPAIDLVFGVQNHDIEAAEVVWRFFAPALLPSAHAGR
jgi:polyhydroxybutyrate depolymerase